MITRVEIDGFKSLRGFAVDLEPSKLRVSGDPGRRRLSLPTDPTSPPRSRRLPPRRAEIRANLARHVPSFKSFEGVTHGDELRVGVELTSGQRLPARVLSDGTLRLLALFLLLRSAPLER